MKGDTGPYMSEDGEVWVPRTVPYLEARQIARQGYYEEGRDRLVYLGKSTTTLLGFTRDCLCEEVCELRQRDEYGDLTADITTPCRVPAWAFRLDER